MSTKWKIVFSLLAVFIVGDIIFLLYPKQVKSSLLKKLSPSYYKEKLIGNDFIALSEDKILSLLSLPENKGKIIIPGNIDEKTKIEVVNLGEKEREAVKVSNFLDGTSNKRVIFYAGQANVSTSIIPGGANIIYNNGDTEVFVSVDKPSKVLLAGPKNKTMLKLGEPLIVGFANKKNTYGEYAFDIYGIDKSKDLLASNKILLKYKERWVILLTE